MGLLDKVRNIMLGADYDDDDYEEEYIEEVVEEPVRNRDSREPREKNDRDRMERERSDKDRIEYMSSRSSRGKREHDSNILNLPSAQQGSDVNAKVVICRPEVVDDSTTICEHLKNNNICVVNLEGIDRGNAQRIADFLGGACYSLAGEIQRISNEIFLIAPANVGISSELKENLKTGGSILPWISSAFK